MLCCVVHVLSLVLCSAEEIQRHTESSPSPLDITDPEEPQRILSPTRKSVTNNNCFTCFLDLASVTVQTQHEDHDTASQVQHTPNTQTTDLAPPDTPDEHQDFPPEEETKDRSDSGDEVQSDAEHSDILTMWE